MDIASGGANTRIQLGTRLNGARPGDQVRVTALSVPGASAPVASGVTVDSISAGTTTGPQWTAVILLSGSSAGAHPYADKVHTASLVYPTTNPGSARSYYAQDWYGLTTITGSAGTEGSSSDVYGPYTLSYSGCDFTQIQSQTLANSTIEADINYTNYHRIILAWNNPGSATEGSRTCGRCSWARTMAPRRLSGLPSPSIQAWARRWAHRSVACCSTSMATVLVCWHANALECGSVTIGSGTCSSTEYGDRADVMGTSNYGHFNGAHKDAMNSFTGLQRTDVTGSGSYTINAYEDGANNTKVLRIPRTWNNLNQVTGYYYLEYRQPPLPWNGYVVSNPLYGLGVLVHASGYVPYCSGYCGPDFSGPGGGGDTHLLDTKPNSTGNDFTDAPVLLTETYTDSRRRRRVHRDRHWCR